VDHPQRGKLRQAGIMVKLSATPGRIRQVDPQPGEHTEAILGEAGYPRAAIAELRRAGVVD
jgi:crotonobetainyl-CoA:carnitine CoA-transferase CaiB-like acyl-CoA transferase